ncbi:hypothetical protein AGABI1DRAFT_95742 [Agaricus bisporus var. burnettii JB137-S8]|uniref:Uncharacterized protein n=1 Tax=Agaricus bisporus var. burnettii (strain JB137-S8 / ATCC MYA-4627 / FGSC 10392) TaxID=597362 RepID=K5WG88_AGABU|nr:uncharacterized protein AGABI1DRAFT_95742 [Agaricus bisporus var. burnettii JB137-S8]EKM74286.1 hypothetical protein AGABI1DRAFT_95742 [Agaricus bisporus var. burnettii JB137-S8]
MSWAVVSSAPTVVWFIESLHEGFVGKISPLRGVNDWDTWSRRVRNFLMLAMVNGSDNSAWEMSGSPAPPLPSTDPVELRARALLSARASAIIESHLPNSMLSQAAAQTDARALWSWLEGQYGQKGPTFAYERFVTAQNFKINDSADPSSAIADLYALFAAVESTGALIHESIRTMMLLNALPNRFEHVAANILAEKRSVADLKWEETRARIIAAWRNPHTVANAARFRQQNQPKPKWDNKKPDQGQGKSQGSGSGSGSGQNQNKQQQPQQKKEGEQQSEGNKKKRTRSRKKKQGNEASTASIEEVKDTTPDYSASSAIASMARLASTSTRAKIDEMKSRLGNHTISGEEFFFFPDGNMIDLSPPDTDIDSWTLPRLRPATRNLLSDESDVDLDPSDSGSIPRDPRKRPSPRHTPTPYERAKTKALSLWDQRLNAVTVTAPPIEDGAGQVGGNAPAVKMPATKGKEVEKMDVDKADEVSLGDEDGEFEAVLSPETKAWLNQPISEEDRAALRGFD